MITSTIIVCVAAFLAGFIDAIVGGRWACTNAGFIDDVPAIAGGHFVRDEQDSRIFRHRCSIISIFKRVTINWKLVGWVCLAAFCSSFCGSALVSFLPNKTIKPIILGMLVVVGIYTYTKKNFGEKKEMDLSFKLALCRGIIAGFILGFYDGFIGPGTGSFLVLVFISLLGCDFLNASANAKAVNLATNLASILYFSTSGHIIYELALPMVACNMTGGYFGSRLALLRGNKFIRVFFLISVSGTIIRFAYDIFFK